MTIEGKKVYKIKILSDLKIKKKIHWISRSHAVSNDPILYSFMSRQILYYDLSTLKCENSSFDETKQKDRDKGLSRL